MRAPGNLHSSASLFESLLAICIGRAKSIFYPQNIGSARMKKCYNAVVSKKTLISEGVVSDETKVDGTQVSQTLQFDLLDDETRAAVIKCIQDKCKFSVVIGATGEVTPLNRDLFGQIID